MANDILNSKLLVPAKVTTNIKTSKIQNDENAKVGNSLFDNILSKAKKDINNKNTEENNSIKMTPKTSISELTQKDIKAETNPKLKLTLLDKIVKNISINNSDNKEESSKNTNKDLKAVEKNIINISTKADQVEKEVKNEKKEIILDKVNPKSIATTNKISSIDTHLGDIEKVVDTKLNKKVLIDSAEVKKIQVIKSSIGKEEEVVKIESKVELDIISIKSEIAVSNQIDEKTKPSPKINSMVSSELVKNTTTHTTKTNLNQVITSQSNLNNEKNIDSAKEKPSLLDTLIKAIDEPKNLNKIEQINPLSAKIFLSEQRTSKELISNKKIVEVKNLITSETNTVKDVTKAAEILELKAEKISLEAAPKDIVGKALINKNEEVLKDTMKSQNNILNKMFLSKNSEVISTTLEKQNQNKVEIQSVQNNVVTEKIQVIEDNIKISVDQTLAQNITTKIIGARQKMDSMMSEGARNMYLNYKPPVTAFKISLNPMNLGNIAVTMRSNKVDNSISVSLNMSQSSTLEAFSENKSVLQNALNKVFNGESSFSLDLNMQNDSSSQTFEQFQQNSKNNRESDVAETVDEPKVEEETIKKDQSYM
jgi:hypothetical protein